MKEVGIYKIHSPSNKVYIGQSIDLRYRVFKYSTLHCKMQPKLYASLSKYGWKNHEFKVLHNLPSDVSQDVLNSYEEFYLQQFKDCGFEVLNVRGAGRYGKISDDTKIKLSNSLKKYYENHENREKKSKDTIIGMRNSNASEKNSFNKKGIKLSEETKAKISKSNMGKICPQSKINILKAHEKLRNRKQSQEEKDKRAKKLWKKIEVDGIAYNSIKEYCDINNLDRAFVQRRLKSEEYKNFKYLKK
jgi:group I intron endonuclease